MIIMENNYAINRFNNKIIVLKMRMKKNYYKI